MHLNCDTLNLPETLHWSLFCIGSEVIVDAVNPPQHAELWKVFTVGLAHCFPPGTDVECRQCVFAELNQADSSRLSGSTASSFCEIDVVVLVRAEMVIVSTFSLTALTRDEMSGRMFVTVCYSECLVCLGITNCLWSRKYFFVSESPLSRGILTHDSFDKCVSFSKTRQISSQNMLICWVNQCVNTL